MITGRNIGTLFILHLFLITGMVNGRTTGFHVDSITTLVDATLPPFDQVMPGDTLYIDSGKRNFLLLRNFQGSANIPILVVNSGGEVTFDTDHHFGISVQNCRYLRLTGTGNKNNNYGFRIRRVSSGAGIGIGGLSSDIEIDHVAIENCKIGGIYAKTDPDCSLEGVRDRFTQHNTLIHDNYISNSGNEGLYVGSTKYFGQWVTCNGKDTLLMPSLLEGVRIYNNIIVAPGWDGIQVSSASKDCQIFDNVILFDSQATTYGQMSGILIGGGSKCDCFNNFISNGKGTGIENHGTAGYRVFNNIIVDAGRSFYPEDPTQMKHGIFVSDVSTISDSAFNILFNTIINPKSDGIRFSSIVSRNNAIYSNVIINPGAFDYYENGNTSYKGEDAYVMITDELSEVFMSDNYFARTIDNAGFADSGYTLLPTSVLIDAANNMNLGVDFDFYHHSRPYGKGFDIGAFEFDPEFLQIDETKTGNLSASVFPVPASNYITFLIMADVPGKMIINVFNSMGRKMLQEYKEVSRTGSTATVTDLSGLPDGVFYYRIQLGGKYATGKFLKL